MTVPRTRQGKDMDAGVFQPEISSFRLHLAAAGQAAKTVRTYTEAVQWFAAAYLAAEASWDSWDQVTGQDIERWMVHVLRQYSSAYASNQYQGLQQFFKWLAAEEELPDPMAGMRPPLIRIAEWPPMRLDFRPYQGDVRRLLADTMSEPTVTGSLFLTDQDGTDWVVLDSHLRQADPRAHKYWRGLQQLSTTHTFLIPAADASALLAAVPTTPRHSILDLAGASGHADCCYVGEVGRTGPACDHRYDRLRQFEVGGKPFQIVPTVEHYTWEGTVLDCSIGEPATMTLPSTFMQQHAVLSFDLRGPSWLDPAGRPAFTYYKVDGNDSTALLARTTFLRKFLAAQASTRCTALV
jgi:hypothetical protein